MGLFESLDFYFWSILLMLFCYETSICLTNLYNPINKTYSLFQRIFYRTIIVLPVAIVVGLRGIETGADTFNMYHNYLLSTSYDWSSIDTTGILFPYFRLFIFNISNGLPFAYFFSMAFFTIYMILLTIEKYDYSNVKLSLWIYFLLFGPNLMNQSRQLCALSAIFYAFYCFRSRRYLQFWISAVIAGALHMTSVLSLVFYFIVLSLEKAKYPLYWAFFAVVMFVSVYFGEYLSIFSLLLGDSKYSGYLSEDEVYDGSIGMGLLMVVIPLVTPLIIFRKNKDANLTNIRLLYMVLPIRIVGYTAYFLYRLFYYYSIYAVFVFPDFVKTASESQKNKTKIIVLAFSVLYFVVFYCWKMARYYFPYTILTY